jgi:hypothetical protein
MIPSLVLAWLALGSGLLAKPPTILFIAVGDLRPELGCYGVEAIRSANIDRLARSGVMFERAHCQVADCSPSRVSVMTGLRPDSSRVWTLDVRFRIGRYGKGVWPSKRSFRKRDSFGERIASFGAFIETR